MTKRRKITRPLNLQRDEVDDRDFPLLKLQERISAPMFGADALSWKDEMSSIKDQGKKGSCVGFATAAMKEWQERAEHLKEVQAGKIDYRKGKAYNYSEQWIYHQCKKIDAYPGQEGTSIRDSMKVLRHIGCPPEAGWPYDDELTGEPEGWAHMVAQWAKIGSYYRITSSEDLVQALHYGPVVIGIPVFRGFFFAGYDGWIEMPPSPDDRIYGGHAVCVVGYNILEESFEFKNSWNKTWGNKGYGKLHFDYIDKYMWDGWVAVDLAVEKIESGALPEIEEVKSETPTPVSEEVKPKRQGRRPAVPFVRLHGYPVTIRM